MGTPQTPATASPPGAAPAPSPAVRPPSPAAAAADAAAGGYLTQGAQFALSDHFTLGAFTFSETATRNRIDNRLPSSLLLAASSTCALLERIRAELSALAGHDVPLFLTSGYRCLLLNRAVGSSDTSDHVQASAADFHAPAFGSPLTVAQALAPLVDKLGIGQLIHEFGAWVHVGRLPQARAANRVITIDHQGTRSGILPVRA